LWFEVTRQRLIHQWDMLAQRSLRCLETRGMSSS
jgi:hypothetical protein